MESELELHRDLANYLEKAWKTAFDAVRKEKSDPEAFFGEERSHRKTGETAAVGTTFSDLDETTRKLAEWLVQGSWEVLEFRSLDAANQWLLNSSVASARTRPYAYVGGLSLSGEHLIGMIGLVWPSPIP